LTGLKKGWDDDNILSDAVAPVPPSNVSRRSSLHASSENESYAIQEGRGIASDEENDEIEHDELVVNGGYRSIKVSSFSAPHTY
jgi:hypothetical protein